MSQKTQKYRTPNAAQKDQHKPVWNTTIKIPVSLELSNGGSREEEDSEGEYEDDEWKGEGEERMLKVEVLV